MEIETFKTQREFNNQFPSKFFICCNCGRIITDKYTCTYCGWRADGLFQTMGKGYKYIIEEVSPEVQEIFKPLEKEKKENDNDQSRTD